MSEMKPTPGPWTVAGENAAEPDVMSGEYFVATCLGFSNPDQALVNARLIAEAGTVFHNTGLSPVQLVEMVKELKEALTGAQQAINSMKVEAETAAQGDEQMMLEACETISNEGLDADMAIRAALAKCEGVGNERV